MTWNLENLFPAGHISGPLNAQIYEQKLKNLSTTILGIAPDILACQEVGDPSTFADLQRRLGDKYPYTMLSSHPDARGIRVGLISRLPLVQAREFHDFPPQALTTAPDGHGGFVKSMGSGVLMASDCISVWVHIVLAMRSLPSQLD